MLGQKSVVAPFSIWVRNEVEGVTCFARALRAFADQRVVRLESEMGVGTTQAIFTFAVIAVVLRSLAFRIAAAR
jgi:hypothetical protein